MKKTLEYLHKLHKDYSWEEIDQKIILIWEKLNIVEKWWNFYFDRTIDETMDHVNWAIRIWIFVALASVNDRIYAWTNKKNYSEWLRPRIGHKKWWKIHLVCEIRNLMIHGSADFESQTWMGNDSWIAYMTLVHINQIDLITEWKKAFEKSRQENWWNEPWAESSRNDIIRSELEFKRIDLDSIDHEIFEMVSTYFNNILDIKW